MATSLTPNYVIAYATVAIFLFSVVYALFNAGTLISTVEVVDGKTGLLIGGVGGSLVMALLLNVRDIYQFFFRKVPKA